jgi:hypothetical protein
MAKINIKNLTLDVAYIDQKEDYEKAVQRAFESISPEAGFINLIKVKFADIPTVNVQHILRYIKEDLTEHGLTNCVFVPIHPQGIQDITIEKIEVVHED